MRGELLSICSDIVLVIDVPQVATFSKVPLSGANARR